MSAKPRLSLCLGLAALAWAAWHAPRPAPAAFAPPSSPPQLAAAPAFFQTSLLPAAAPSAHAASLAQLPDGTLVAAWFAGSSEGAEDVAIYLSRRLSTGWSAPEAIATRAGTARELRRHLRKLGNPVLHVDDKGRLHLFFVSVSLGGWAGGSINHKFSSDGGLSWSPAEKFTTSPFLNISTLVRTPPLPLSDGGLGLPAYHEFLAKHGEWLRLGADGRLLDKVRLPQERAALQPAVVPLDGQRALALLRDAGPGQGHVLAAHSQDAGLNWQAAPALAIPHSNASVALLRLDDGSLLLAGNPGQGRDSLLLYLSRDQGQNWQALGAIESGTDKTDKSTEFSYPSLLQDRAGQIHLAYTWRRQGIRHVAFNRAWLTARSSETAPGPAIAAPESRP